MNRSGMIHLTDRTFGLSFESDNIPHSEFDQCYSGVTAGAVGAGTSYFAIPCLQTGLHHIHVEIAPENVAANNVTAIQLGRVPPPSSFEQVGYLAVNDVSGRDEMDIICKLIGPNPVIGNNGAVRLVCLTGLGVGNLIRFLVRVKYLGRQ